MASTDKNLPMSFPEFHGHRRHVSAGLITRESLLEPPGNVAFKKFGEFKSDSCLDADPSRSMLNKLRPIRVAPSREEEVPYTLSPGTSVYDLPFSGKPSKAVDIEFTNLSYSVQTGIFRRGFKNILQGISGDFRSGELTAVMGLSGAGKSTLLDILTGYITSWTGSIQTNGEELNAEKFRKQSCYIMQDDHLQPLLTVQEAMNAAVNLKMGSEFTHKQKQSRVKQILDILGLYKTRNTLTGSLSGGQKKRLSIAFELINNPPVMFFDEPTSGLDSSASKQCISLLRKLAHEGKTIICTIHQPSALLLEMFDHLYVLAHGKCTYQGSVSNVIPFLRDAGHICPPYHNPADFFLEVASGDYGPAVNNLVVKADNGLSDKWRNTKKVVSSQLNVVHIESLMSNGSITKPSIIPMTPSITANTSNSAKKLLKNPMLHPSSYCKEDNNYPTSFFTQISVLMLRNVQMLTRDMVLTYVRFIVHLCISLIVGMLYFQIGMDSKYTLDNFKFVFFTIMFLMFTAFSSTTLIFPLELPMVRREHFNRWYSVKAYYFSSTVCDAPIQFISTLGFTVVAYFMTGQPIELFRIWYFFLMCLLVSFVAQSIGMVNGAIFSIKHAVIFGPLFIMPFVVFSGFFVYLADAPGYLHWLFHISYLKYGLEGVMLSIFGFDREKLACSADYCHFRYPDKFLDELQMKHASYSTSVSILIGLYLFIRICTYFIIHYRLRHRQS